MSTGCAPFDENNPPSAEQMDYLEALEDPELSGRFDWIRRAFAWDWLNDSFYQRSPYAWSYDEGRWLTILQAAAAKLLCHNDLLRFSADCIEQVAPIFGAAYPETNHFLDQAIHCIRANADGASHPSLRGAILMKTGQRFGAPSRAPREWRPLLAVSAMSGESGSVGEMLVQCVRACPPSENDRDAYLAWVRERLLWYLKGQSQIAGTPQWDESEIFYAPFTEGKEPNPDQRDAINLLADPELSNRWSELPCAREFNEYLRMGSEEVFARWPGDASQKAYELVLQIGSGVYELLSLPNRIRFCCDCLDQLAPLLAEYDPGDNRLAESVAKLRQIADDDPDEKTPYSPTYQAWREYYSDIWRTFFDDFGHADLIPRQIRPLHATNEIPQYQENSLAPFLVDCVRCFDDDTDRMEFLHWARERLLTYVRGQEHVVRGIESEPRRLSDPEIPQTELALILDTYQMQLNGCLQTWSMNPIKEDLPTYRVIAANPNCPVGGLLELIWLCPEEVMENPATALLLLEDPMAFVHMIQESVRYIPGGFLTGQLFGDLVPRTPIQERSLAFCLGRTVASLGGFTIEHRIKEYRESQPRYMWLTEHGFLCVQSQRDLFIYLDVEHLLNNWVVSHWPSLHDRKYAIESLHALIRSTTEQSGDWQRLWGMLMAVTP